jgi:hypothetical protein
MNRLSPLRLNALRAMYALIAFAMGANIWPKIVMHGGNWSHMGGLIKCMMGALTLLALLGIRYPIKMLPLLFWELAWKTIWLIAVLPQWSSGAMDADTSAAVFEIALVVLVYLAIPWRYVLDHFVLARGEPWRREGQSN